MLCYHAQPVLGSPKLGCLSTKFCWNHDFTWCKYALMTQHNSEKGEGGLIRSQMIQMSHKDRTHKVIRYHIRPRVCVSGFEKSGTNKNSISNSKIHVFHQPCPHIFGFIYRHMSYIVSGLWKEFTVLFWFTNGTGCMYSSITGPITALHCWSTKELSNLCNYVHFDIIILRF